jgi:hypothetical protein
MSTTVHADVRRRTATLEDPDRAYNVLPSGSR